MLLCAYGKFVALWRPALPIAVAAPCQLSDRRREADF
jgi:hypothetical protein